MFLAERPYQFEVFLSDAIVQEFSVQSFCHSLIHFWIKTIPLHDVGGILYFHRTILPAAVSLDDDAATQMLVLVFLARHIVDEGIVLLHRIGVAACTLGVEEEDLPILHADHKIYIEERLQASLVLVADTSSCNNGGCYGLSLEHPLPLGWYSLE